MARPAARLRMSLAGKTPEPPDRRRLSAWLQERLFERRIVLVSGRLDADIAAEAAAALMTLDTIGEEPIDLHLDSAARLSQSLSSSIPPICSA